MRIPHSNGMLPTFNRTITVLNRLQGMHSPTKLDTWKKTVLMGTAYSSRTVRTVIGSAVSVGNTCVVRVPENTHYLPYSQWARGQDGFTFSVGDIVIKGEISETEVTPQNCIQILQKYRPNAFTIKVFKDNTQDSTPRSLAGHYYIEGV